MKSVNKKKKGVQFVRALLIYKELCAYPQQYSCVDFRQALASSKTFFQLQAQNQNKPQSAPQK